MTGANKVDEANQSGTPGIVRVDRPVRPLLDRLRDAAMNRAVPGYSKRALIAEAAVELQDLRDWLEGDALCPCCQQVTACLDGCTFGEDDPNGAARMEEVRIVLWGPNVS